MPQRVVYGFRDYDNEMSRVSFDGTTLTAANFETQVSEMAALATAVDGMSLGHLATEQRIGNVVAHSDIPASDPTAHRELKWMVLYHDTVTYEKYRVEIPCPDLSLQDTANRGHADRSNATVQAFEDAFEAFVEKNGHTVAIDDIVIVGRSI